MAIAPRTRVTSSDPRSGTVIGVHGSVIDMALGGGLPAIHELVAIEWDGDHPLTIEVEQHFDEHTDHTARGVALQVIELRVPLPRGGKAGLFGGAGIGKGGAHHEADPHDGGERSLAHDLAMAGALGWMIAPPSPAGVAAGRWLDRELYGGTVFTSACVFAGTALGCALVRRRIHA